MVTFPGGPMPAQGAFESPALSFGGLFTDGSSGPYTTTPGVGPAGAIGGTAGPNFPDQMGIAGSTGRSVGANAATVTPVVNDTAEFKVRLHEWRQGWEKNILGGSLLFAAQGVDPVKRGPRKASHICADMAMINYFLEDGAATTKALEEMDVLPAASSARAANEQHKREFGHYWAQSVAEFGNRWQFVGIVINDGIKGETGGPRGKETGRVLPVCCKGNVLTPNIWGEVKIGDCVGFRLTKVRNPYTAFYSPTGEALSGKTVSPGAFLQIVPAIRRGSGPWHCSSAVPGVPNPENDLDWVEESRYSAADRWYINPDTGIPYADIAAAKKDGVKDRAFMGLTANVYELGEFIPVGVVVHSNGDTRPAKLDKLLRSQTAAMLQRNLTVEVNTR